MKLGLRASEKDQPRVRVRKPSRPGGEHVLYVIDRRGPPGSHDESSFAFPLRRKQSCSMSISDPGVYPQTPGYPNDYMEITTTYCRPDQRRKGFSTLLHEEAAHLACKLGYKGVASHHSDRSDAASAWWRKARAGGRTRRLPDQGARVGWDVMDCQKKRS